MPKIRPGMPKPPKGFEAISPGLDRFEQEMKDAIAAPTDGKRRVEATWDISRINRQRTRHVFNAWKKGEISEAVVKYCAKVNFIDGSLVKLWQVTGYEKACCAACVQPKNHEHSGSCVCRVPAKERVAPPGPCAHCGCHGCCTVDLIGKTEKKDEAIDEKPSTDPSTNVAGDSAPAEGDAPPAAAISAPAPAKEPEEEAWRPMAA